MARPAVFIDGEAGTTGLQIRERLARLERVDVLSIDPAKRKDAATRKALMAQADAVILCLPDDAAREAVALADSLGAGSPRIVDASTAYRVADGWTYGFAELDANQASAIAHADRVSNPGCYPTGAIALLRPLVDAGIVDPGHPITINAVSGYSGGGNPMIAAYEVDKTAPAFELYGLGLEHKHVPELQKYARLTRRPIFVPSVGNFRQGMLVSVPLHLDTLAATTTPAGLHEILAARYARSTHVAVVDAAGLGGRIPPENLNGTDTLELFVFGNADLRQAVLVARLDNLGKGAAGAAVQNLSIMLGLAPA
jgi:N-acetyl-gamma-glutamyl-phosphate reductase